MSPGHAPQLRSPLLGNWERLPPGATQEFGRRCEASGFDLVQPFQVGWYNEQVAGDLRLDALGNESNLALIVGNTRRLWSKFVAARRGDESLRDASDPLDQYTERCVEEATSVFAERVSVRWAHQGGRKTVAVQRAAQVAGLAFTAPSHLSVHPEAGPWIGLRAIVVVAVPGPVSRAAAISPCGHCVHRCVPALQRALQATRGNAQQLVTRDQIAANFSRWLACRDSCPKGEGFRYTTAQIRYHYLADRTALEEITPE